MDNQSCSLLHASIDPIYPTSSDEGRIGLTMNGLIVEEKGSSETPDFQQNELG
jgi:hypothetical protein